MPTYTYTNSSGSGDDIFHYDVQSTEDILSQLYSQNNYRPSKSKSSELQLGPQKAISSANDIDDTSHTTSNDPIKRQTVSPLKECMPTPACLADKYRFVRKLGHGTQGKIYLAERLADQTEVAIKQLNIESVKNWKEYDLFKREATVLESIHIEGVATFYEAIERLDEDPPCSYIVQEYIEGHSLAQMLKAGHRFSLIRVYDIIIQLLKILRQLHAHNPPVIHRDIKPSNILLKPINEDDYQVYLIDFGAVANPQVQSGGSTVAGTFGFMPPEQLTGKPAPGSDIYSLAAVAVNLISGKSPADMPVKDFYLIFEPDVQNMPPALVNTLRAMLEPNVEERLTDIDQIIDIFEKFKQNAYDTIKDNNIAAISQDEYEHKLKAVSSICESGNIDLWQKLPDKTPRALPICFQNIKMVGADRFERIFPYKKKRYLEYDEFSHEEEVQPPKGCYESIRDIFVKIQLIIVTIVLTIAIIAKLVEARAYGVLFAILFGLFIAIATFLFIKMYVTNRSKMTNVNANISDLETEYQLKMKKDKSLKSQSANDTLSSRTSVSFSEFEQIIKNGRKTIAVITEITYIPAHRKYIDRNNNYDPYGASAEYAICSRPMFKISYKFNPPDDEKSEDLVHSFLSPVEPEGHYRVGDCLPILYALYRDEKSKEHVDSMPFPVPLHDIVSLSDVAYKS